jgi:hypothetical protein
MGKTLLKLLWGLPSLVLLIATAVIIGHVSSTFQHDATLRWTVIAAVLTGSALIVGVIGLPFALYQLFELDRDLSRRPKELRKKLDEFRLGGTKLAARYHGASPALDEEFDAEFESWVDLVATFIRTQLDEAEEQTFLLEGKTGNELGEKLTYIRDKLIPKVIAGYW